MEVKNDNNLFECRICLEEIKQEEKIKAIDCAHIFHESCIDPWLRQKPNCPICRTRVTLLPDGAPREEKVNVLDTLTLTLMQRVRELSGLSGTMLFGGDAIIDVPPRFASEASLPERFPNMGPSWVREAEVQGEIEVQVEREVEVEREVDLYSNNENVNTYNAFISAAGNSRNLVNASDNLISYSSFIDRAERTSRQLDPALSDNYFIFFNTSRDIDELEELQRDEASLQNAPENEIIDECDIILNPRHEIHYPVSDIDFRLPLENNCAERIEEIHQRFLDFWKGNYSGIVFPLPDSSDDPSDKFEDMRPEENRCEKEPQLDEDAMSDEKPEEID